MPRKCAHLCTPPPNTEAEVGALLHWLSPRCIKEGPLRKELHRVKHAMAAAEAAAREAAARDAAEAAARDKEAAARGKEAAARGAASKRAAKQAEAAAKGIKFHMASESFQKDLRALAAPITQEWLKDAQKAGVNGPEALEFYRAQAASNR